MFSLSDFVWELVTLLMKFAIGSSISGNSSKQWKAEVLPDLCNCIKLMFAQREELKACSFEDYSCHWRKCHVSLTHSAVEMRRCPKALLLWTRWYSARQLNLSALGSSGVSDREPVTWWGSSSLYGLEHEWKSLLCARLKFKPEFSTLFQLSVGRGTKIEIAEFLMLSDT